MRKWLIGLAIVSFSIASQATSLLFEDFEGATNSGIQVAPGVISGTAFSLVSGSIDIKSPVFYPWICASPAAGNCVDTTGSTASAPGRGVIETTDPLNLSAGAYVLSFSLVRWNDTSLGGGLQDASLNVSLGPLYNEDFIVDNAWTNQTVNRIINVASASSEKLRFTDTGGSAAYAGAVLDNVSLDAVPEPSTLALFGLGLAAVICGRRRLQRLF